MEFKERYKVIVILFVIGSIVLLFNLLNHQVLNSNYSTRAENRTLTKKTLVPSRGIIIDRNENLIVVNQPTYELEVVVSEIEKEFDKDKFCTLLNIEKEEYDQVLQQVQSRHYYRKSLPITFLENINPAIFSKFQEHLYEFSGFYPVINSRRYYPYPHGEHAFGYISEVNSNDLKNNDAFEIGDKKGVSGLEKTYDQYLRGIKGTEYLLKDNRGKEVDLYKQGSLDSMSVPGNDLKSTMDIALQSYGELLMQNKRGGLVAIEPKTGEILAMISSPGYDPNKLSFGKQRSVAFLELLSDTLNQPILNRAVQSKYPPGSIFKPILGLIAMQERTTYASKSMNCSGEYVINEKKGFIQGCRDHPKPYNIQTALQFSCNTYFYQIMRDFINQFGYKNPGKALDLLNTHLSDFGLGHPLGVDLLGESTGFIPSTGFFNDKYKCNECWRSTYILSLGIGQGELELTTLQMANLAAIIANRGYYIKPHLIKQIGTDQISKEYVDKNYVKIDSIYFEPIIEGMKRVIDSGTGFKSFVKGISIAGKTGTSQNPQGIDHSVFFAFAPAEDPKIAIAVYVENAGGGGTVAAPLGGLMIEKYLTGEVVERRKRIEQTIKEINLLEVL